MSTLLYWMRGGGGSLKLMHLNKLRFHHYLRFSTGNLSGSSETGAWDSQDGNLNILQGCIRHRCAPLDWQLEMTPVDFISNVVTYMVKKGSDVSGKIYHIVDTSQTLAKLVKNDIYWPLITKLSIWNVQILEAVRWRDPRLQVSEHHLDLFLQPIWAIGHSKTIHNWYYNT